MPRGLELTVEQARFLADRLGAGTFPWVLAIPPPSGDPVIRTAFDSHRCFELVSVGAISGGGTINPDVVQWITTTCRPQRWLELRFVTGSGDMLRGLVAWRGNETVVALRNGQLIAFTSMAIEDPQALVPVLTAGLSSCAPARFDQFVIPARIGARADDRLRNGAALTDVVDYLDIPRAAQPVVAAAFSPRRTYVEIIAGHHRDGHQISTNVGVGVVDTDQGRILVAPSKANDGEWVSTFSPGTPLAIAIAVQRLSATLPDGPWFPNARLTRNFDLRTEDQCPTQHHPAAL